MERTSLVILTPFLDDYDVIVYEGDCIEVMREMPEASVDAIVTDPPYGLEFMGKDWDRPWAVSASNSVGYSGRDDLKLPAHRDNRNANCRSCGGRQRGAKRCKCEAPEWDRSPASDMQAFQSFSEAWAREAFRILKPGGHLLAFAGTRTYHRMASGVEDAGFEIRDCIAWMYGSGFPKSLDVSKAIDKLDARDEQEERRYRFTAWVRSTGLTVKQIDTATGTNMGGHYTTDASQPAIMTRKHLEAVRHLVADVPAWVEAECDKRSVESRNMAAREVVGERSVPIGPGFAGETYQGDNAGSKEYADTLPHTPEAAKWNGWGTALKPAFEPIVVARKPLIGTVAQNVLEHGTGALNIDGCRIESPDGVPMFTQKGNPSANGIYGDGLNGSKALGQRDFITGRWPANVALDETAASILDQQSGERSSSPFKATTDGAQTDRQHVSFADLEYSGRGYTDTGGASRFFYTAKASRHDRNAGGLADNTHPTVKPTELMRWLIRLVTPPDGIILDPFGGSGSTGVAARAENVRCILIERETEYLQIIRDRLAQLSLFAIPDEDAA
jgi:DNA modification methylase